MFEEKWAELCVWSRARRGEGKEMKVQKLMSGLSMSVL
jgi:hypothetical protein